MKRSKLGNLKNSIKMNDLLDPATAILNDKNAKFKLKKIANSLRTNWPATSEDIGKARKRHKKDHIRQWAELRSPVQGVVDFTKEKLGNV